MVDPLTLKQETQTKTEKQKTIENFDGDLPPPLELDRALQDQQLQAWSVYELVTAVDEVCA